MTILFANAKYSWGILGLSGAWEGSQIVRDDVEAVLISA